MPNYLHQAFGTLYGQPWSVNMVSTSASSEAAAETAWHGGVMAAWNTAAFLALMSSAVSILGTSTSTANAAFKQTTKTETLDTVAGGSAAAPLSPQCCLVISHRSASATKWGRGRSYWPGLASSAMHASAGTWSAAAVTDAQAAMDNAWAQWLGPLQMQILHRRATRTGPGADTLTPITGSLVSNKIGIQRRRGDKIAAAYTTITI